MSAPQVRQQPAASAQLLPLRSLTGVWIALSLLALLLVAFAGRGLVASKAKASDPATALAKGPTKQQVRERQEHIALTQRALELARKERKAAAESAAAAPASAASGSTTAAPVATEPASKSAAAARTSAAPAPSAAGVQEASAPAQSAAPPAAAPKADQPKTASGLDEMRADIAAALE